MDVRGTKTDSEPLKVGGVDLVSRGAVALGARRRGAEETVRARPGDLVRLRAERPDGTRLDLWGVADEGDLEEASDRRGPIDAVLEAWDLAPVRKAVAKLGLAGLREGERKLRPHALVWMLDPSRPTPARLEGDAPCLVLLHGIFSTPSGAFSDLAGTREWASVVERYGNRVCGWQHPTVGTDPFANARALVDVLPEGATVDLLTHSRGGLVADLLVRPAGQAGPGRPEFADLKAAIAARGLTFRRTVRVAAPGAGSHLAGPRLVKAARGLGALLSLAASTTGVGGAVAEPVTDLLVQLLALALEGGELPGWACMNPDGDFVRFLARATPFAGDDKLDVRGKHVGGSWLGRVVTWLDGQFLGEGDTDLVVPLSSMRRGVPRERSDERTFAGQDLDHLTYFRDRRVLGAIQDHLVPAARRSAVRTGARVAFVPGREGSAFASAEGWVWAGPDDGPAPAGGGTPTRLPFPPYAPLLAKLRARYSDVTVVDWDWRGDAPQGRLGGFDRVITWGSGAGLLDGCKAKPVLCLDPPAKVPEAAIAVWGADTKLEEGERRRFVAASGEGLVSDPELADRWIALLDGARADELLSPRRPSPQRETAAFASAWSTACRPTSRGTRRCWSGASRTTR